MKVSMLYNVTCKVYRLVAYAIICALFVGLMVVVAQAIILSWWLNLIPQDIIESFDTFIRERLCKSTLNQN